MIKKRLIVYIPCFNEEKNISKLIQSWDIAIKNTKDVFILFINIMYLYLNKSCSDLSPEQQCICYDLEKRNNPKYLDQYKNSCKKFRPLND